MALMLWHNIISGANQANCDVPIVPDCGNLLTPYVSASLRPSKYMRKRQKQIKQQMHYIPFLKAKEK